MYHVQVDRVDKVLTYMEKHLPHLQSLAQAQPEQLAQEAWRQLAAERLLHTLTEAITDVSALLIDGFMMRDPGSYQDMVEILGHEEVFPEEYSQKLARLIAFRRRLVSEYTEVSAEEMYPLLQLASQTLPDFPGYIRQYLEEELF